MFEYVHCGLSYILIFCVCYHEKVLNFVKCLLWCNALSHFHIFNHSWSKSHLIVVFMLHVVSYYFVEDFYIDTPQEYCLSWWCMEYWYHRMNKKIFPSLHVFKTNASINVWWKSPVTSLDSKIEWVNLLLGLFGFSGFHDLVVVSDNFSTLPSSLLV